jgi:hypothetical protein
VACWVYQGHFSGEFLVVKKLQSFIAFILSIVIVNIAHALPLPTFRTVALMGQSAPGLPIDTSFLSFGVPSLNSLGQVSFSGTLTGPPRDISILNNTGIWTEGIGSLALLARENDPAAGATAGQLYSDFNAISPNISDSGDVAWLSSQRAPASSLAIPTIWSGNVGTLMMHTSVGSGAPGLPAGVNIAAINEPPVINSQGDVAYRPRIAGPGVDITNQWTLWKTNGGPPELLARQGDSAPGTSENFATLWVIRINDAGQVGVSADLTSIDSGTQPQSGLWLSNGNVLELQVKDFSPAPGVVGAEFNISQSTPLLLNSSGEFAFRAFLRESVTIGVDTTNDQGIWSSGTGSLQLVAREGGQAPGIVAGGNFFGFDPPKFSNGGQTAFIASLAANALLGITPANSTGLWSDANGNLQLVARAGDQAPGMPMGAVFDSFFGGRSSVGVALNAAGHAAFFTSVTGGGVTSTNNTGLWAQDQNGNLRLVLREGELFEVAPGDFRTISFITFQSQSAGGEGLARGFNDNYQLALHLNFTNNTSGIFVAQVSVPEPGTIVLAMAVLSSLFTRCKQRG